jgi:voltage-gated potassium channel
MFARHRWLEVLIRWVIVYSIAALFIEMEVSPDGHPTGWLLWSERVITAVFTLEYLARWAGSRSWWYPLRPMAVIDLLAVLPGYLILLGTPTPVGLLRVLRLARLLKLDRHGDAVTTLYRAYRRIGPEIRLTALAGLSVGLVATVAVFEFERHEQPKNFGRISDAAWYILATAATVGYGDLSPKTPEGRLVGAAVMLSGLVLFGTFVSLVGGAFVEEIRRNRARAEGEGLPAGLMKAERFDPAGVLAAIESGAIPAGETPAHRDTVRLLERACRVVL